MKDNELNAIQKELKVCLDNKSVYTSFFYNYCSSDEFYEANNADCLGDIIKAGFTWESVQSVGGEGEGETYYTVYKFTKEGTSLFVLFDGVYYSYDGATFQEWRFVEPKQKIIIVYS